MKLSNIKSKHDLLGTRKWKVYPTGRRGGAVRDKIQQAKSLEDLTAWRLTVGNIVL